MDSSDLTITVSAVEGEPQIIHTSNATGVCLWRNSNEERRIKFRRTVDVFSTDTRIFNVPTTFQMDGDILNLFFKIDTKSVHIEKYIDELYLSPSGFCDLNSETLFSDQTSMNRHTLLQMAKIIKSFCEWEEKAQDFLLSEFGDKHFTDVSKQLFKNLWITVNLDDPKLKMQPVMKLSPILLESEPTEIKKNDSLLFNIARTFGCYVMKLNLPPASTVMFDNTTQPSVYYKLDPIDKLIKVLLYGPRAVEYCTTFQDIMQVCEDVVSWFSNHTHWPEIMWDPLTSEMFQKAAPSRCLVMWGYDKLVVEDFYSKVETTGSTSFSINERVMSRDPKHQTKDIFSVKPIAILINWDYQSGLRLKVVLNSTAVFQPAFMDCIGWSSTGSSDREKFVKNFPKAVEDFVAKLVILHEKGHYFPFGSLLHRSHLIRDGPSNYQIGLRLYGPATHHDPKLIDDAYPYAVRGILSNTSYILKSISHLSLPPSPLTKSILDLNNIGSSENGPAMNIWEIAIFLITIYKYLIESSPKIKMRPLSEFVKEAVSSNKRIALFQWKCGDPLIKLVALITERNEKNRVTAKQLLNHRIFKNWIKSNDLFYSLDQNRKTEFFISERNTETDKMRLIAQEWDENALEDKVISININWKLNMTILNASLIIQSFTAAINSARHKYNVFRNRGPIRTNYMLNLNNEFVLGDFGVGVGVLQDALMVYCEAVNTLGIFKEYGNFVKTSNTKVIEGIQNSPNILSSHWFALGFLMNHCIVNEIDLHLDLPLYFYKLAKDGWNANLDLSDLHEVDETLTRNYLELLFLSEEEVADLCLTFDGDSDPMLRDLEVNQLNSDLYIRSCIRNRLLKGYNILFVEALCEGYKTTPPEVEPTPVNLHYLFSRNIPINYRDILSKMEVVSDQSSLNWDCVHDISCTHHSTNISSLIESVSLREVEHGNRIFYCGKSEGFKRCPMSCLAQFLCDATPKTLSMFLSFVTSSPKLNTLMEDAIIKVFLKQTSENSNIPLPTARTCGKTLVLTYHPDEYLTPDSYQNFAKKLMFSLTASPNFGFV